MISLTDKTNVLTLAACRKLAVPVIVAERTDPRYHSIGRVWSLLARTCLPPDCRGGCSNGSHSRSGSPAGTGATGLRHSKRGREASPEKGDITDFSGGPEGDSQKSVMSPFSEPERRRVLGDGPIYA